jgi:biotin operon repressor
MKRVRKLMTCECGFPGVDRNRRHHRLSVYHRQHRRISSLLSNNSLSFADIGDRLGITRERVRQIARQLGMTSGRQRQEQRALHQRMPAWQERKGYRELIAKGKEFGCSVTPRRVDSPEGWRFQARNVVINRWRAHIVYMKTRGRYLAFSRSDVPADFYVGISPIGFFIFPSKIWKTFPARTSFSPMPCPIGQPGFTRSHRHDYLNYLEAWKLLGGR